MKNALRKIRDAASAQLGSLRAAQPLPVASGAFFVTSYGRTATYWLTSLMNAHPDVFCTHGPTLKRLEHFGDDPPIEHGIEVRRDQDAFYALSLTEALERMKTGHKARIYGNVHAYTATRLQAKLGEAPFPLPVAHVNLLRHPFTRLESYAKHNTRECRTDPALKATFEELFASNAAAVSFRQLVSEKYKVDFSDFENNMFVYSLIVLGNDFSDTQEPCLQVNFERLVADLEYFLWLFRHLTHQQLPVTDGLVDAFRKAGRRNSGKGHERSSHEVVQGWEEWKRYMVGWWVRSDPSIGQLYNRYHYDLSAIKA